MKVKKIFSIFILLITLAIGIGALSTIFIFKQNKIHILEIVNDINNIEYVFLIPIITILNIIFRYFRWNLLLRDFNIKIPSRELFSYFLMSFIGNITPYYILHIIRIFPLLKRKIYKGILIFILDVLIDILSILILFNYYPYINFVYLTLVFILFLSIYLINKTYGKFLYLNLFLLVITLNIFTILLWIFSAFTLYFSLYTFDYILNFEDTLRIFTKLNLTNIISIMPVGIFSPGFKAILLLEEISIPSDIAIKSIFIFRILTTWTVVAISIFVIIIYRKSFLKHDKHFNTIADEYTHQIADHIREKVLNKKIQLNLTYLPRNKYRYGLDAGCGQGWYLKEMLLNQYKMKAIDYSEKQVEYAKKYCNLKYIYTGSITNLPFKNNEFDFIYTINVLHHLNSKKEQSIAIEEFYRVLKPGGRLILHEINVRNPLYRFYMSYVFPLINSIDEGIENWIELDKDMELFKKFKIINIEYFTFLPDFLPKALLNLFLELEKKLEISPFFKKFSAHYCIILEK